MARTRQLAGRIELIEVDPPTGAVEYGDPNVESQSQDDGADGNGHYLRVTDSFDDYKFLPQISSFVVIMPEMSNIGRLLGPDGEPANLNPDLRGDRLISSMDGYSRPEPGRYTGSYSLAEVAPYVGVSYGFGGGSTAAGAGPVAGPAVLGPRPKPIREEAVILPEGVSFWSVWN